MMKFFYHLYGIILIIIFHIFFLFSSFLKKKINFKHKNYLSLKEIKSDKIVIFGSSKSLLKITQQEKQILKTLPKVFMNKNLIYWKKINLWPEFYFLLDTPIKSKPVKNIFFETLKVLNDTNKSLPILLLEEFYRAYTPKNINKFFFKFNKSKNLKWANNDKQTLFGSHGSITSLLNIISIFKKFKYIILVGVEFNQEGYFFSKKQKNYFKFIDRKISKLEKEKKIHSNLIKVNNVDVLSYWPMINSNLNKKNIKLYCASKNSELVKRKLVRYMSIKRFKKL